jgi:hypothetical protein
LLTLVLVNRPLFHTFFHPPAPIPYILIYKTIARPPTATAAIPTLPLIIAAPPVGDVLACAAVLDAAAVEEGVAVLLTVLVKAAICASSKSSPPLRLAGCTPALALEAATANAAMSLSPVLW